MKKRIQAFILSLVMLLAVLNINMSADSNRVSFSATYDGSTISLVGFAGDKYAGKPVAIALKAGKNSSVPLYINDTVVTASGGVALDFAYPLEQAVSKYYIQISVAGAIKQIIGIGTAQTKISGFQYYDSGAWKELTYDVYQTLKGSNKQIRVTVPETAAGTYFCAFAVKSSESQLDNFVMGTSGAGNTYSATLDIPADDGVIEVFYWNSTNNTPVCEKTTLPDDCVKKLTFNENAAVIAENPGKGWVRMATADNEYNTSTVMDYTSVGYTRFNWAQIEPTEGSYNWTPIDNFISLWAAQGKKAAFGIACASSTNSAAYLTPQWVFDAGAAYTVLDRSSQSMANQYVPVWNDSVFLAKLENFTKAFAKRYDGDSRIAFIDIRSYGNFGETHVSGLGSSVGLTAEQEKTHIDIATRYFKNTQLIIPTTSRADQGTKTAYAASKNVGLRSDSVMDGFYAEQHNLDAAYGKAPAVFEFVNMYSNLVSTGVWDSRDTDSDGIINGDENYIRAFFTGKPSYMDLGQYNADSSTFITDKQDLIDSLSNKMGYHFVCKNAELPAYLKSGEEFTLNMQWKNSGIAPLYEKCYVAVALLDSSNNVIDKVWLDSINPQNWGAGETVDCSAKGRFLNVTDSVAKVAVGLFSSKGDANPSFKVGNYNLTSNKWFVIATATASEDECVIAQIAQPAATSAPFDLDGFYTKKMAPFTTADATGGANNVISDTALNKGGYNVVGGKAIINWFPIKTYSAVVRGSSGSSPSGYSGQILGRSKESSGAQIDVTDLIRAKGPGTYTLSGSFYSTIGSRKANLCLRFNSVDKIQQSSYLSSSYSQISGSVTLTQSDIDNMTHAVVLIIGDNRGDSYNTNDIYFHSVKLVKN